MRLNDIWRALAVSSVPGYEDRKADPGLVLLIRLVSAAVLGILLLVMAWLMLR